MSASVVPATSRGGSAGSIDALWPAAGAAVSADALRFSWRSSPAESYRVMLLSDSGEPIWSAEVTDTTARPAPAARLRPGSTYFWRVDALLEGRSLSSGVQQFRLAP